MPTFTKQVRISSADGARSLTTRGVVDTGASYMHIPAEIARQLQLLPLMNRSFRLANGSMVNYEIAVALVEIEGHEELPIPVAIGKEDAPILLGALALDIFGLGVDTERRQLIPKVLDLLTQTNWPTI